MDRIDALRAYGAAERADLADETVINRAPYYPVKTVGGTPAYREEYIRDHGPDLDEWLDGTESGQEI